MRVRIWDQATGTVVYDNQSGDALSADAADAANSLILDQVAAGVSVRMSVLYELLGGAE